MPSGSKRLLSSRNILLENQDKLHQLAEYLIEKETIIGEEFMELFEK